MMLMGDIMTNVNLWPGVLTGELDQTLRPGMFFHVHGREPQSQEELEADESSLLILNNLKRYLRNTVQGVINDEARRIEREQKAEAARMAERVNKGFREMNKPAPEGTVRELAEKFNAPISQIRKLKAENRLHELTAQS